MMLLFPLAFGFVTPAFALAGTLLVAVPIAIHLLNRRRFKTVEWAAMAFLLQAMRRNRRRLRFESWLLLAARCCVFLLLGLALARPMGCDASSLASFAARRAGLHILVIDNSYSMAYEADRPDAKTNLDQAKLIAKRLVSRLNSGGDSVAIVIASKPATAVIVSPTYDLDAARNAIDRISQTYSGTDLAGALDLALKIGQEQTRQPNRFLDILSDATRPAWEAPEQIQSLAATGSSLGKLFHITHYNVARPGEWNAAVTDLNTAGSLLRRGYLNDLLATVRGYGGAAKQATLQWKLDDQTLSGMGGSDANSLSPDSPPITQSRIQFSRGGAHVISLGLAGVDDRIRLDDVRQRVVNVASDLKILIVEGERGASGSDTNNGVMGGSGSFLFQALSPIVTDERAPEKRASYFAPELISDLEFGNKVLSDYRAIILAGVAQLTVPQADAIKKFVDAGGTLMLFMGEPVSGDNYNATLLPRGLLPGALVKRITAPAGRDPFYFDFRPEGLLHPLLKKFRGVEKSGLDRAAVYTYWQVDLPRDSKVQRVLNYSSLASNEVSATHPTTASAEVPDAAITLQDEGQGHVLFASTSAYVDWSTLPGKLNFAPLLHELLIGTISAGDGWMNLAVGDSLRIPPGIAMTAAPTLKDAQQNELLIEQSTTADGAIAYHSRALTKPGVYTLSITADASAGGSQHLPIAVNVPAEEADVRPIEPAAIRKALGDAEVDFRSDELPSLDATSQELAGRDYGWSFMLALLVLAAMECAMAMRFGHYAK